MIRPFKLSLVVFLSACAYAQTLNPVDSQFMSGEVNLQNLSVNITAPVISKPGAIPFSYALAGNSRCGTIFNGVSSFAKCGISTFGLIAGANNWQMAGQTAWGMTAYSQWQTSNVCSDGGQVTTYSNWYLQDSFGRTYELNNIRDTLATETGGSACAIPSFTDTTVTGGLTVTVSNPGNSGTASVATTYPNGFRDTVSGGGYINDTFGNSLRVSNSPPVSTYSDTLTSSALSFTYSMVDGSRLKYSYLDTTGTTQNVTPLYATKTIKTSFNCANAPDQTITGQPVTSEIDYPDGANIYLTYEPVTGGVTGRISQITLRTGGTISYSYGAINCASMIPSSLSRTTVDGTTTYSFATFTGQNGKYGTTTTVLDPGKNKTVYTFMGTDVNGLPGSPNNGFLYNVPVTLTQVQVYQNTGTVASPVYKLLSTTVYCYGNPTTYGGNPANCPATQTTYPITQKDIYNYVDTTSLAMSHVTELFDTYGNLTSSSKYDYITQQTLVKSIGYGSWNGGGCSAIGSGIIDKPCWIHTTVTNANGPMIQDSRFTYNSKGALTQSQAWTGTQYLVTNYTPNPNGNGTTTAVQTPTGQVTNIAYDGSCNGLVPTSTSTTIGGVLFHTAQTWNCNGGFSRKLMGYALRTARGGRSRIG